MNPQMPGFRSAPRSISPLLGVLESADADAYSRYRILHHLLKPRRLQAGAVFRLFDNLPIEARRRVTELIPSLLATPAFELNLLGLCIAQANGLNVPELKNLVRKHATRGCEPLRDALSFLGDSLAEPAITGPVDYEADELPDSY